ncbi:MAG TPA: cobalamin-binding protein [Methylomirabilota bacterium]|nr:cobalamin-binding protein [Methylomirabilota bacterium]
MRAAVLVTIVAALVGLPAGVRAAPPPPADRAVVDDLGREVALPATPRRIVSLAPNLTEIVFALGAGDRLVGVTDFCDYPAETARIARVGGVTSPSAERVLSLRPDLVLATTVGNGPDEVLALARLGLPVVVSDPRDLAGVARSFELVARAAGVPDRGSALASEFRGRIEAVRRRVAGRPRPRTLVLVWPDPIVAAGPSSFVASLLGVAGGTNALAAHATPLTGQYPTLGIESIVALAPEVIVLAAHPGTTVDSLARLKRYGQLPAVRDGRLATIDQALLVRPGPRLALAAEALAKVLHP